MIEYLTKGEREELGDKVQDLIYSQIEDLIEQLEYELWEIIRLNRTFPIPNGIDQSDLLWWAKEEFKKWL